MAERVPGRATADWRPMRLARRDRIADDIYAVTLTCEQDARCPRSRRAITSKCRCRAACAPIRYAIRPTRGRGISWPSTARPRMAARIICARRLPSGRPAGARPAQSVRPVARASARGADRGRHRHHAHHRHGGAPGAAGPGFPDALLRAPPPPRSWTGSTPAPAGIVCATTSTTIRQPAGWTWAGCSPAWTRTSTSICAVRTRCWPMP